jgi:hypothetical protein
MAYLDEGLGIDQAVIEYFASGELYETAPFGDFIKRSRNSNFSPDINGYTLIYMIPPNLSGVGGVKTLQKIAQQFPFLALDFTPPETIVKTTEETSGASISIPYSTGTFSGGQLSINYIEDSNLNVVNYHNTWVEYIKDVVYGEISPNSEYIDGEMAGALDYATSAYVIKFKPDMKTITYVGKATGIFPLNVPSKEVIGNRQSNELSMVGCNYNCAMYTAYVAGGINSWVLEQFYTDLIDYFELGLPLEGGEGTVMLDSVLAKLGIDE